MANMEQVNAQLHLVVCCLSPCRIRLSCRRYTAVLCRRWLVTGLIPCRPGFFPRAVRVGFVGNEVSLGQLSLQVLHFLVSLSFHPSYIPVFNSFTIDIILAALLSSLKKKHSVVYIYPVNSHVTPSHQPVMMKLDQSSKLSKLISDWHSITSSCHRNFMSCVVTE